MPKKSNSTSTNVKKTTRDWSSIGRHFSPKDHSFVFLEYLKYTWLTRCSYILNYHLQTDYYNDYITHNK